MTYRRFLTISLWTLTLVLTACSHTEIRHEPVSSQFGEMTPGAESAERLAVGTNGVYVGGQWNNRPALIKFTRSGRIPWVKSLPTNAAVRDVVASPDGAVYLIYSRAETNSTRSFFVSKYNESTAVWTRQLANGVTTALVTVAAATDKGSNLYLATSFGRIGSAQTGLRKFWSNGTQAWQKLSSDYVFDMDTSANGFTHTVSDVSDALTLSRYKPDGSLLWRVAAPQGYESQAVAVGRENEIYVASNAEIYPQDWFATLTKYDSRGAQVWQRSVQDGIGLRVNGLDADNQGNAFLALSHPEFGQESPYRFKEFFTYSPSGKRLLLQAFGFGSEEPLVGPGALAPTEVYLALSGVGSDGRDGLLMRLDGLTGKVSWQR